MLHLCDLQLPVKRVLAAVTRRLEKTMTDTAKATVALWAYYTATPTANELVEKLVAELPKEKEFEHLRCHAVWVKPRGQTNGGSAEGI